MEEKITVTMTPDFLFDFTLYHTYSKLAGFLSNVLGLAIAFMGIILLVTGKIHGFQIVFYLVAAAVFIAYTPVLLKVRAKKQVSTIKKYKYPNIYTFGEQGIDVTYEETSEHYPWEKIEKVVTAPKTIGFYYGKDDALIIPKQDFKDRFVPIMTMVTKHVRPGSVKFR